MHRFRKKSDIARQQQQQQQQQQQHPLLSRQPQTPSPVPSHAQELALPDLPAGNDFRSSVIIPTLSRRFTLLRSSQGEASFDSLRGKFAEQRAVGAENQITEEEEDLMLDALDHISRGAVHAVDEAQEDFSNNHTSYYGSLSSPLSAPATPSSASSLAFPTSPSSRSAADAPPTGRATKRHSNNLFGSGRFRDASYIRTARATSGTSQASMSSASGSRSRYMSLDSTASSTISSSTVIREPSISTLTSFRDHDTPKEEDETLAIEGRASSITAASIREEDDDTPDALSLPALTPSQQRRISLAVQAALQSLTPNDDDDIVVAPRSARSPPSKANGALNGQPHAIQPPLFANSGADSDSLAPRSAISDDFDNASELWSRDDDPFSAQDKSKYAADPQRDMHMHASSPPPEAYSPPAPASAPAGASTFALGPRPASPTRADSTTPRAVSPPAFLGHTVASNRSSVRGHAPQLSSSILPRSALPRNDSPAPGLHGKSNNSFSSLAEMVRGISRGDTSPTDQDEPARSVFKQSPRAVSPPQGARSPAPSHSSPGPSWMAGAAYYQHLHRGMDTHRAAAASPDYGHERHGSTSMSDESVLIDPYRFQPDRSGTSPVLHGRTKSMLSSRSLSSPPLPDSPTLDGMPSYAGGIDYGNLAQAWILDGGSSPPQHTPIGHSRMGSVDYGGGPHASARPSTPRSPPFLARSPSRSGYGHRNMTPEPEYGAQSVAAAANIRHLSSSTPPPAPAPGIGRARSNSRSRYHSPTSSASSSFNINSSAGNPLVLAPFNASAASVASAGSSYHSDCGAGEDDLALRALLAPDPTGRKRKWNDFTGDPAIAPRMVVVDREDGDGLEQREPMDVLQNILGMGKGDVLSLQDSLLHAMLRVKDTVDPPPKRAPSLRRRRGSIGESISSRTTSPAPGVQHVSPKNSISPFNAATHQLPAGIVSHVLGTSSPRLFSPGPPSAPMSPAPEPPSSPGPLTGSDTERERTPAPRNQFGNKSHDPRRALLTSMMESIESRTPLHQNGQVVGIPGFPIQESAHGQPVPPAFAPVPPAPAPAPSTSDQPSLHLPLTLADLEPRLISAQFTEQQVPASPMVRAHAESKRTAQPAATPSTHTQLNFARPLSPQLQSPSRAMSPIEIASGMVSPDRSRSPVLLAARSPSPQEPPPPARSPLGTKPHHAPSASQSSDLSLLIRNQALADAIFGPSEDDALLTVAQAHSARSTPSLTPEEEQDQMWHTPPLAEPSLLAFSPPPQISSSPVPPPRFSTPSPTPYEQYMSDPYDSHGYDHSPNKGSYNSSSSPVPPSDDAQLEQDVRRKVEQATAALKQSTSQVSLRERSNSIRRKRIDPSKISGPHLMSASTSVEAMPSLSPSLSMSVLASPVEPPKSAGSKFSQRFKKFGTWRNSSKPSTPIHDEPQHPNHNLSPYTASSATPTGPYHPQSMRIDSHISQMNGPASASLADVSHFRFPANSPGHSPPASAGPVFKSLVSRLGKPFGASSTDLTSSQQRPDKERGTSGQYMSTSPKSPTPSGMLGYSTPTRAPSELRRADSAQSGRYAGGGRMSSPLGSELPARGRPSIDEVAPRSPEYALQSIYDAASQAGLNSDAMEELSALLSRSMSTTSASSRTPIPDPRLSPTLTRDTSIHRPVSPPVAVERKSMIRASVPRPQTAPRSAGRDEDTRSVVIRRTIYMPSDANKGGGLSRRPSHVSHKRQSSDAAMSTHSSRYPYDRSGSPPLASRSLSRLAATEAPPPMPDFNAAYLEPGAAVGGTSSSIVDMYGDSRAATPARDRHLSISPYPNSRRSTDRGPAGEAPGQALEVLELADGRVVWQVVDGLRDEFDMDSEPDFRSRASFSSDYSMQEREDVTLHMREHRRGASKGSLTSVNAQRKATYNRPQTKVFYSDAEHIGRLIESMTHGIDSGSFTVQHNGTHNDTRPGRAERGSFDHGNQGGWSMEEHLEHVLQHVGPKSGPRAI